MRDEEPTVEEMDAAFARIAQVKRARRISQAVAFAVMVVLVVAGMVVIRYFGYIALAVCVGVAGLIFAVATRKASAAK